MPVKITIVTPVYNGARFISQTIESVLSQKGNFFIEYIVVDDGSTDNSLEIIKKYHDRLVSGDWKIECLGITFKYVTGPNQGQSRAYNRGFTMAEGDMVAWMNADDYYLPGALEKVTALYASDPTIDLIYTDCLKVYEDKGTQSEEPRPRPDETLESLRSRGNSFDICYFSKRIYDKLGPLDESLHYCLDLDFWFKVFASGKVAYLPYTTAAFRIWSGSKTGSKQEKFTAERKLVFKRHGGNMIPPKKIYALRAKLPLLTTLQKNAPGIYNSLKKSFYRVIDIFKY